MLSAGCDCGNLVVNVTLTREPSAYEPRACDCGFCTKHGAAYVSDPAGRLEIQVRGAAGLGKYRQGSGQAEMLVCPACGVLIGACYEEDGRRYGVVNARVLGLEQFGSAAPASPRLLEPEEKTRRWKRLWFGDVDIRTTGS